MKNKRHDVPSISCTPSFLKRFPPRNDTILTRYTSMSLDTRKTFRNNNIFVFGGCRESIYNSFVKPNLLQGNCSYVIHDVTGELLRSMSEPLKQMGYEIRVLNLSDLNQSHHYNPFRYIQFDEDILLMVSIIMHDEFIVPDSKYTPNISAVRSETALLQALFFYVQSEYIPEKRNFCAIQDLLCQGKNFSETLSVLDTLFENLEQKSPEHRAVQSYNLFRALNPGTTGTGYIHSIAIRLQVFRVPAVCSATCTEDDIDLYSVGDKPVALFCISDINFHALDILTRMFYTQLFNTLYFHAEMDCKLKHLPRDVRFFLNDFETIGWLPELTQKVSTMRPYNISCCITAPSISSLKIRYPDEWEIILGNCDSHIFFGMEEKDASPDDLKYLGKQSLNKYVRDLRKSNCLTRMRFLKAQSGNIKPSLSTIFGMGKEDCLVFFHGADGVFDKKYSRLYMFR